MKSFVVAMLLLVCTVTAGAAERVADILQDHRRNGVASAFQGLVRLKAAQDRPKPGAPLELQREYLAAQGSLAVLAHDWAEADRSIKQLQALSSRQGCRPCQAEFLRLKAGLAVEHKQLSEAKKWLQQAVPLAAANDDGLQLELALLGSRLHAMQGESPLALSEAVRAARLADRLEDVGARISALQMMVIGNVSLQDFEHAQSASDEALALARRYSLTGVVATLRLNESHLYALTGQSALQLEALQESLRLSENDPGHSEIHMLSLSNLAAHALDHSQFAKAERYARRAEALGRRLNNPQAQAAALVNWGLATTQLGDLPKGVSRVREGIAISDRLGMKIESAGMTEALAWMYYDVGQFQLAYQEMQALARRSEALTVVQHQRSLVELQEQYAADRRQHQLVGLIAENRLRSLQLQADDARQQLWITLLLIPLLLAWLGVRALDRLRGDQRLLGKQRQALSREAECDALTGAFNRHYCDALMEGLARQPVRPEGMGVGLLLLDVDHFKRINDAHGHVTGDGVLIGIAARVQRLLRPQDALVRWGGEEFLIVLHATSREGLVTLASRLLAAVAGTPVSVGHLNVPVSVSIGTLLWSPQCALGWTEAVDLADRALYQAKAEGRHRAVCILTDVLDAGALAAGLDQRQGQRGLDGLSRRIVMGFGAPAGPSSVTSTPQKDLNRPVPVIRPVAL